MAATPHPDAKKALHEVVVTYVTPLMMAVVAFFLKDVFNTVNEMSGQMQRYETAAAVNTQVVTSMKIEVDHLKETVRELELKLAKKPN